jgi:hypothetical protein
VTDLNVIDTDLEYRERLHESVLEEVADELRRQLDKWGIQNHPAGTGVGKHFAGAEVEDAHPDVNFYGNNANAFKEINDVHVENNTLTWMNILLEELFEAGAESQEDIEKLVEELVQTAAVAVAFAASVMAQHLAKGGKIK